MNPLFNSVAISSCLRLLLIGLLICFCNMVMSIGMCLILIRIEPFCVRFSHSKPPDHGI
jgi:hypothetical protein